MGFIKAFKDFAMKGNLVDIAVAFVMGAAFSKVVTSFTEGMVAPLVGMLSEKDLSRNAWILQKGTAKQTDTAGNIVAAAIPEVAV